MPRFLRQLGQHGGTAGVWRLPVIGLAAAAVAVGAATVSTSLDLASLPTEFWVLAVVAVVAEVCPLPVAVDRRRPTVFLSFPFTFAIVLLWGPLLAIGVQTLAVAGAALRQRFTLSWAVFTTVRLATALAAAGVVLQLFSPPPGAMRIEVDRYQALSVTLAAATWFVVSYAILGLSFWWRDEGSWRRRLRRTVGNEVLAVGALLLLAPVFVGAPTASDVLLLLVPVIAVSQLARLSAQRENELRHDSLTGLLGRRGLIAEIRARTGNVSETGVPTERFALILLDLDRFKNVNDALGHMVGDRLLAEVARRLAATVRPGDLVARLGGDEFVILAPEVATVAEARQVAARIATALRPPTHLDGLPLDVGASIGVALYPEHGHDHATLLRHADVAMYQAKRSTDTVATYCPRFDFHSPERLGLLADLRSALQEPRHAQQIRFHYQPQIAIGTGDVVGLEALLRWHHPERGRVDTEEVVRVAENSTVMQLLTRRAFHDVVRQLATWNAEGLRMRVSVNVSVRDLHRSDFVDYLAGLLGQFGVHASQIEVEITETALMADPHPVLDTVRSLARLGVGLALDDLGTGYSSLQHLRRLPLTEVKVDQSFVRAMAHNRDDEAIVRTVIELAGALGLRVVAEGVEDDQTHRMLAEAGCDIGQGWHYARDMPPDELRAWLVGRAQPVLSAIPTRHPKWRPATSARWR